MTSFEQYLKHYADLIPSINYLDELKEAGNSTLYLFQELSEAEALTSYAPGKWTLKQILQHLTDVERIFSTRALRFSRQDATALPGMDEKLYAAHGNANNIPLKLLIEDFKINRDASHLLFRQMLPEQYSLKGKASGNLVSVHDILQLLIGHNLHHLQIISERYLPLIT